MNPNNTYTNPTTGQTFKELDEVLYDGHRWVICGISPGISRVELSSNTRFAALSHENRRNLRKPFFRGLGGVEIPVGTEVVSGGIVYRVEAVNENGVVRLATRSGYAVSLGGSLGIQDPILKNATPTQATYANARGGVFRVGDVLDTSARNPSTMQEEPLQVAAIGGGRVWLCFADGTPYKGLGADYSYSVGSAAGMRHAKKPCAAEAKKVEELSKELVSMKQKLEQEKALRLAMGYGGAYGGAGAALGKTEIVSPAMAGFTPYVPPSISNMTLKYLPAPKPAPVVPFRDKDGIDIQVGDRIRQTRGWNTFYRVDSLNSREVYLGGHDYRFEYLQDVQWEAEDLTFTNAKGETLKVGDRVVLKVNPVAHYIISRIRANGRVWLEVKQRHSGCIEKVDGGGAQQAVLRPSTDLTLYVPTVTITRTVTYTGTPEQIARFKEAKKEQEFRCGGQQLNFPKGSVYISSLSGVRMAVTDLTETSK